jgi:hypothetical protein
MRIACCIPKTTNTHSGCEILIAFPLKQGFMKALQCYIIRSLYSFVTLDFEQRSEAKQPYAKKNTIAEPH